MTLKELKVNKSDDQGRREPGAPGDPVALAPASPLGSYRLTNKKRKRGKERQVLATPIEQAAFRKISFLKHLRPHLGDVKKMLDYINSTKKVQIRTTGDVLDHEDKSWIGVAQRYKPYIHRFHAIYRRAILAKFYQLDEWYSESPKPVTLVTMTCRHDYARDGHYNPDGYTIEQSFQVLKKSWQKLSMVLRYHLGDFDYVWVFEPHKMGYPHIHLIIFQEIPEDIQAKITQLCVHKYDMGSEEHAVNFEFKSPEEDIKSVKNYLMKYIVKSIEPEEVTPGILVFNAVMWARHYRLVGASARVSKAMARKDGKSDDFIWTETSLVTAAGDILQVRKRDDQDTRPDCGQ